MFVWMCSVIMVLTRSSVLAFCLRWSPRFLLDGDDSADDDQSLDEIMNGMRPSKTVGKNRGHTRAISVPGSLNCCLLFQAVEDTAGVTCIPRWCSCPNQADYTP